MSRRRQRVHCALVNRLFACSMLGSSKRTTKSWSFWVKSPYPRLVSTSCFSTGMRHLEVTSLSAPTASTPSVKASCIRWGGHPSPSNKVAVRYQFSSTMCAAGSARALKNDVPDGRRCLVDSRVDLITSCTELPKRMPASPPTGLLQADRRHSFLLL